MNGFEVEKGLVHTARRWAEVDADVTIAKHAERDMAGASCPGSRMWCVNKTTHASRFADTWTMVHDV